MSSRFLVEFRDENPQADSDSPFGFGAVAWGHVLKNRFRFNVSSFLGVRYYDGS